MGPATAFLPRPRGPLGGVKRSSIIKFQLQSQAKTFIPNFVCVLRNERYKTYQTGFSFCFLGHAPGVGLRGAGGAQGWVNFVFKNGHVAYHID